jgi:hypothetical protein
MRRSILSGLFILLAAVLLYAALPATDAFTRADGAIGGNWLSNIGSYNIESNQARPNSFNADVLYRWSSAVDAFGADQYSQAVMKNPTNSTWYGVAARVQASGFSAYTYQGAANERELNKFNGGTWTRLGSSVTGAGSWANNDTMKLEVVGTLVKPYRNGALDTGITATGITDSTFASGQAGIAGNGNTSGGGVGIDDWQGDNVSAGTRKRNATISLLIFPSLYR